jgi:hypothetical protein
MQPRKPGAREQSKDASDDEAEIDTYRTDRTLLLPSPRQIPTQSIDEIKAQEPKAPDDAPKEDSMDTIDLKIEDCI